VVYIIIITETFTQDISSILANLTGYIDVLANALGVDPTYITIIVLAEKRAVQQNTSIAIHVTFHNTTKNITQTIQAAQTAVISPLVSLYLASKNVTLSASNVAVSGSAQQVSTSTVSSSSYATSASEIASSTSTTTGQGEAIKSFSTKNVCSYILMWVTLIVILCVYSL